MSKQTFSPEAITTKVFNRQRGILSWQAGQTKKYTPPENTRRRVEDRRAIEEGLSEALDLTNAA